MKIINCPACGRENRSRHYCLSCGCYLPPVLEEENEVDTLEQVAAKYHLNKYEYQWLQQALQNNTMQPAQSSYTYVPAKSTYISYSYRDEHGRLYLSSEARK